MNYPQIKPTLNLDFSNTKTLDPRINFRRGTPGAYYDGKTYAKAEENLISHSEDFSQAGTSFGDWDSRNVNTTTDSTDEFLAPNGEQTAWKLSDSTSNSSNHSLFQLTYVTDSSQEVITSSIFAKAGDSNRYLQLLFGVDDTDYGLPFANFDLFEGTITRNEKTINASMTDAGNGWYRCSITIFTTTISGTSINPVFYMIDDPLANRDQHYVGDGSSGLYIWGAQLEQRDAVTAYTPTNGAPVTKYQPQLMFASPDQPRFDHDVLTGESKGLLIEESRTNLIAYSEDFANMDWSKYAASIVDNITVAPDGNLTGGVLSADLTDDGYVGIETRANYINYIEGEYYTSSYYLKKGSHSYCQLFHQGSVSSSDFANFNLDTGEVYSNSSALIEYVGNGWYRCSLTSVCGENTTTAGGILIMVDNMSSTRAAPKTFTNTDDNIYIWGAQLEVGSFPTSYIKTSGASVTRSADNASITGENFSSWYRQDEGTFQIDFNHQYDDSSWDYILSINPSTEVGDYDQNNLSLRRNLSNEKYAIRAFSSGSNLSTSLELDGVFYENNFKKLCLSYDRNNVYLSNKNQLISDSTIDSLRHLKALYLFNIDGDDTRTAKSTGYIKKLAYYPQRLTNEQLQQLTK
jgi:hypothetical protein